MNGKRLTALCLALVLSMSVIACQKTEEVEAEAERVAVEVQTPRVGMLSVDTAYIGTVAPQEQVYVMPKTSGTVTETFFEVGDIVKEGDVLFKIDDEAAQLQMANARASYESAQAGVTAQNSGARDLQNYQTEEQIRQLRDSLYDTDDKIDELEDTLGDLRDAGGNLSAAKKQAQAGIDQLNELMVAQSAELQNMNTELQSLNDQLNGIEDKESPEALEITASIAAVSEKIAVQNGAIDSTKLQLSQAQAQIGQIQTQIDSINATKTQIKSGIDSAEDGRETINDNLAMAEQAYSITQNEIYPESDAVSAAQLQMASVGIDSAQMQLDFCTVTSPISGVVESVSVEKNGMAAAGNPAYIISNKESMTVTFHVAEKAKNAFNVGDHIRIEREGEEYDGVLTEIGTMANPQTKLFQVKASVSGGASALPNGVSVKVYATTQKEDGKLIVPYDTIYFSAGNAYIYCVENGQVAKVDVTVGLMNDTEAVIEEGITADSQVISNWSSKLRNGVEVDIVSIDGEENAPIAPEEESVEEPEDTEESEESEQTEEET
jgi:RND family efflux transporter MFP subunit